MEHASAIQAGMMGSTWDLRLILLSYLVAVLASYAALDLASVVSLARRGPSRAAWLFFGAVAIGLGIWSMHFTGMLALDMGVPISYDVPLVVASALVAVAASALAFSVSSRARMTPGIPSSWSDPSWASASLVCTTRVWPRCGCPLT